MKDSKKVTQPL